jgi:ER lumen protein retaining receptor
VLFIGSQGYIIYLMTQSYKPTNDPNLDTFRVQYLLGAAAVLAVVFPYAYTPWEILWAFSIWLESVAILPQLFMLQRTGEAETITTHYLFALGAYRAMYIPNWIYRYFWEVPRFFDPIAVIAGIIQTVLYSDFFYIYYTKYVLTFSRLSVCVLTGEQGVARQEVQPPRLRQLCDCESHGWWKLDGCIW